MNFYTIYIIISLFAFATRNQYNMSKKLNKINEVIFECLFRLALKIENKFLNTEDIDTTSFEEIISEIKKK